MKSVRIITAAALAAAGFMASGSIANAQIFLKSPDFSGAPVTGSEAGVLTPLPGAKPEELHAGLIWSLRAALNVAALQCQFEPSLLTLNQYNYLIRDRAVSSPGHIIRSTPISNAPTKPPKPHRSRSTNMGRAPISAFRRYRVNSASA